jgi:phosphatidate cytidylyltransferase
MVAPAVGWTLLGVLGVLCGVSGSTVAVRRWWPAGDWSEWSARVRSWWVIAGLFGLALAVSSGLALALFAFVSFLALKEYLTLIPTRRADRAVLFWAYVAIPLQYAWVAAGWYGLFIIWIPVYVSLFLAARMVLTGATANFLKSVGTLHWGLMVTVFSLSHAAFLLRLPHGAASGTTDSAAGAGLLLTLVLLTQANDVAQYCWGKSLGRRRVVPAVSPGKTWAGVLGGVATTTLLAWWLAPALTPLTGTQAALAGALIGGAGFLGDLTLSAVKRDLGVKDSGALLPGHGGILDRIDSLTFTAPLFFHFVRYLHY